jgi:hypothetical protein
MSDVVRRPRGRPRKYETDVDRVRAFRVRQNLTKVTVDIPTLLQDQFLAYAKDLRSLDRTGIAKELAIRRIGWRKSANIALCYCDWYRGRAEIREKYTLRHDALGRRSPDLVSFEWKVIDSRGAALAGGFADSLDQAKSACEAIFRIYM